MRITIDTTQLRAVAQRLQFSERRTRAVGATVLTRVARQIEGNWRSQLEGQLDRPLLSTQRGTVVQQATAARLQAVVKLRDTGAPGATPADYLAPQEFGGPRDLKKFERALQAQGSMPRGMRVVPAGAAKLDAYGNISRGQIVQVIAQLGSDFSPGYARVIGKTAAKRLEAAKRSGRQYVAITGKDGKSKLPPGVYQRTGRGLVRVFAYVSSVAYRKRLRLLPEGQAIAQQQLPAQARRAVAESLQRLLAKGAGA